MPIAYYQYPSPDSAPLGRQAFRSSQTRSDSEVACGSHMVRPEEEEEVWVMVSHMDVGVCFGKQAYRSSTRYQRSMKATVV